MINKVSDCGSGRPFCFVLEKGQFSSLVGKICESLTLESRIVVFETTVIKADNWQLISNELLSLLQTEKIRQTSLIGISASSAIVQNIALLNQKLVRSLVLIDAVTRPHPNAFSKLIDRIENYLPLGLPLRHDSMNFDSKPFLQRLRCPTLIINTAKASEFHLSEAETLKSRAPTAWHFQLNQQDNEALKIAELINDFETVPAKCPQKNKQ